MSTSRRKGKNATPAVSTAADDSTASTSTRLSPELVLPSYVPPAGALKSRAPGRQNIACRGCRRRKVKCDGSKPSCMSCQVIYKEPCIYDTKPTPVEVEQLQKQNVDLRSLLDSLVSADAEERNRLLAQYGSNPRLKAETTTSPAPVPSFRKTKRTLLEVESAGNVLSHSPEDDMAAAMLSELSMAASGQVEHYGVTSFLHRPAIGAHPSPPVQIDSPGSGSMSGLQSRDVPPELRDHLLNVFFAWQTVHCHVYKPALLRDLETGGPFCSDFLLNVIFAHASRFSDRATVKSVTSDINTAGGVFLARAKKFLAAELDKPASIPTAQGLLILGGRECACGNHSQGFLYTAMGLSMAVDLGVHVDGLRNPMEVRDPLDVEVRRRLFWSCYVWDKSISLCLGRSPRFLKNDRSFFNLPPTFDKSEDDIPWLPELSHQLDLTTYPIFPFRTGAYFEQFCKLTEIIEDILLELYASKRRATRDELQLRRFNAELEGWVAGLDADFLIPSDALTSPPPNRITLSLLHSATTILVNRPFSYDGWGPRVRVGEEAKNEAKQRCRSAANEVVRLLELYDATFKFRNMNWLMTYCAFTAATILTVELRSATLGSASLASRRVEVILTALESQSTVTPGVQRSIELVRHLMINAAVPASGYATPREASSASKRARLVGDPSATPTGNGEDDPLAALLQDPNGWNLAFGSLDTSTATAEGSTSGVLPPPIEESTLLLPDFPEVGPLAWPEGTATQGFDWLGAFDWLQGGTDNGQL
ncbi:hypothetical protein JCM8547_006725 [Rhodosporidiobolus lusitaniae]